MIVIGGGAPGEHCAGALAEGGLRVAVVERELVGGECSYRETPHRYLILLLPVRWGDARGAGDKKEIAPE